MCEIQQPFKAELETLTLRELMKKALTIPVYQRSYTWNSSHVTDLLKDIVYRERSYMLGTIILHKENDRRFDIVDGQQRLVTLTVLLNTISETNENLPLLEADFSVAAASVIKNTQKVITGFLRGLSEIEKTAFKTWLWRQVLADSGNTLFFSVLTLSGENALDRAYTFFDSVNSKGKPLSDFDLLKAHHLMFIPTEQEELARLHNDEWQNRDDDHGTVFTQCLRRLRMWAREENRDNRGDRPDYNEFISVIDPDGKVENEHALTRYMQPAVFRSWRRDGPRIILSMDYPIHESEELIPTEITQSIEGGDPFFIYAKRYHALYRRLFDASDKTAIVPPAIKFIRRLVDQYGEGYKSTAYLREALRPVLLLYVDKFGEKGLIDAAVCLERIVSSKLWSAPKNGLRIEGVLSHVRDKNIVRVLLNATKASHAIAMLFECAMQCSAPQKDTNLKRTHFERMLKFYVSCASCIEGERIREMIASKN